MEVGNSGGIAWYSLHDAYDQIKLNAFGLRELPILYQGHHLSNYLFPKPTSTT